MTTQSSYNMMRDPRMVTLIVLFAVVAALAIWASIADPFGGAATRSASPSVADRRAAVFATTEAQLAAEAKLPKGSALLPIKVTAAETAAVEADDYRAFPYLVWLADLGPWYEAQLDSNGKPVVKERSEISLDPKRVLFLARDGRVWVGAKEGAMRFLDPVYMTDLPPGVTATVKGDLVFLATADRKYVVGIGEPFVLESEASGLRDNYALAVVHSGGGGVYAVVDFK